MATFNHKIEISNGSNTDTYHPETNSAQVYDFTNDKWLSSIIGVLNTLSTTQKSSLVASINEIAATTAFVSAAIADVKITGESISEHFVELDTKLTGFNNAKEYGVIPDGIVGNSDSIQAMINACRAKTIATPDLVKQHTIILESGKYIIDKTIKMSPFVKLKPMGQVQFCVTFNGTGLWIAPETGDPVNWVGTNQSIHLNKNSYSRGEFIDGSNGAIIFTTTINRDLETTKTIAIEMGARNVDSHTENPTSRYVISHVSAFGFDIGLKLNTVNHYLGTFKHLFFEVNNHHVVWGDSDKFLINSGENFTFDNCVFAQAKKQSFLAHKSVDITIENTSFDFNASPLFNSKESGFCLRLSNCYVEMIGNGTTDEQLLYKVECINPSSRYGRNSIYIDGGVLYLQRPKLLMDNIPNVDNQGKVSTYVDITSMEMRYSDNEQAIPQANLQLIDTTKSFFLYGKNNLHLVSNRSILSNDFNPLGNSDFSKSTLGVLSTESDPYWRYTGSNVSGVFTRVGPSIALDIAVTSTSNWMTLKYNFPIKGKPGQIVSLNPSVKIARTNNALTIESRLECRDDADNLIEQFVFYSFFTGTTTTVDFGDYCYPRFLSEFKLPKGTAYFYPSIAIANAPTSYSVNDIQLIVMGD